MLQALRLMQGQKDKEMKTKQKTQMKAKDQPITKKKQRLNPTKSRGKCRTEIILAIVETDRTFSPVTERSDDHCHEESFLPRRQLGWVGHCIHCNTHLYVTAQGSTEATLEHIQPLCDGGDPTDPRNLALACKRCNNEKGVRHDQHAGRGGRADEVIAALRMKRMQRWREPMQHVGGRK